MKVGSPDLIERCKRTSVPPIGMPSKYRRMDEKLIVPYILSNVKFLPLLGLSADQLQGGGDSINDSIKVKEVGDGNLNYVYIVEGPNQKCLIVKQALPYVRCVGESWPMSLRRAYFENKALMEEQKLMGSWSCLPEVYHFDNDNALIGT